MALAGALVAQEEGAESNARRKVKRPGASVENYIGVAVEPVPEALFAHLPALLERGRAVIVTRVVPNSPAANARVRRHDILITYDGQKVSTRKQLKDLVLANDRHKVVRLDIVRAGRALGLDVTLGLRPVGRTTRKAGAVSRSTGSVGVVKAYMAIRPTGVGSTIIISLAKNRLELRVTFPDREGTMQTRRAGGSRDQILQDLGDLPPGVMAEVRRRLDETIAFEKGSSLVSFHMRPFLDSQQQSRVRVTVWSLGEAGKVKTTVFDAAPDVEAIAWGLRKLRPRIREQLEKALRRTKIPRIEVKVDESL